MNTDLFIARVHEGCSQLDVEAVHEHTLITLDTLCEQLPQEQAEHMAGQLPDEIAEAVRAGGNRADTSGVPMTLDEFYDKLMFRTELGTEDVRDLARSVVRTLEQALSDGEADKTIANLPGELSQLAR
ncbi:DUF2267 domain-containing protein [Salinisphaera sp. T31B1]|uniref:DUF2267 domain-containing protein n=1 Tax=Salinisphaera sp. T31B1 TaxID=727963 RepID=UPI00333E2CAE